MLRGINLSRILMKVIGCIPVRYASSRLPGKPLCNIAGKPMILHIMERAKQAKSLHDIVVLTDDERILNTLKEFGYTAQMTSTDCQCGTDRIIEYMKRESSADLFVNIQGDEILLNPSHVDSLVSAFLQDTSLQMGTLAYRIKDREQMANPSIVKVVTDMQNNALYFSRSCIPMTQAGELPETALGHMGIYIYPRETLYRLGELTPAPLEKIERLEQLRALQHQISIKVITIEDYQSLSIDTPDDLEKAQALFASK